MPAPAERYLDAAAHEAFEEHDGQEIVVAKLVPGTPSEVFDAWMRHAWLAPFATVRDGRGRGLVGHQRAAPGQLVVEEILSAGEPLPEGHEGDRIPSVLYKMTRCGPFMLRDHLGLVSFVPDASAPSDLPATLILWNVKLVPSLLGNILCCGGSLVRLGLRRLLRQTLDDTAAAVRAEHLAKRE